MNFREVLIIIKESFIERYHYLTDLEYHLLRDNYEYYHKSKTTKHVIEFLEECINRYSSPTWNTEKTNPNQLQHKLAIYQKLNKLFIHGPDILIKHFNKTNFNQKNKKELLDEFYELRYANINSDNDEIFDDLEFLTSNSLTTNDILDEIINEIKSIKENTKEILSTDNDFIYNECIKQAKRFASKDDGKIKVKIIGSFLYATGLLDDTLSQIDRTKYLSKLIGESLTQSKHIMYPSYYREEIDKPEGVLTNLIIIKYFFKRIKFYRALEIIEEEISTIKDIIETTKAKDKKKKEDKIKEIYESAKKSS